MVIDLYDYLALLNVRLAKHLISFKIILRYWREEVWIAFEPVAYLQKKLSIEDSHSNSYL